VIAGVLVVAACGGSGAAEVAPTTTLHPDDQAIADGFFALCNDGNYSNNTDFAKTCSGGDGISRWLSEYGECSDGTVLSMRSLPDCGDRGGFARLLARDYVARPGDDDVALCNDGNYSNNTDFISTCSGGDGVTRWLAPYGECSDGTVIDMGPSSSCPGGSTFVGLLPDDYDVNDAPASTTTTRPSTTIATATTSTIASTTTTTNVPPPATVAPAVDEARAALEALVVAEPDVARAPYERDDYDGGGWADIDGDCLNTRQEILISYSLDEPVLDGCRVVSGRWVDSYTGETITDAELATIDHVVSLAEAHRAGAWRWDTATKNSFTNDETPGLLVVIAGASNQSKADKSPDRWLPPTPAAHCQYAIDWIVAKSRYALTVTAGEAAALGRALDTCSPASVVRPGTQAPAAIVVITTPTTTTSTPIVPSAGPGVVALVSCDKRAEVVVIANTGGSPMSLAGFVLHDEGRKHEVSLGQFGTLQPGQRLAILTGDNPTAAEGQVVWKRQNVWNNDGDIANLIAPDGTTTTTRC
jgi:hypothetical protein